MEFLNNELIKYENMISNINNLKIGDKFYYKNKIIYVEKKNYLQSIKRFILDENRYKFLSKFKKEINNLNKLLDSIFDKNFIIEFTSLPQNKIILIRFNKIHKTLLKICKILQATYKDDYKYILELDEIKQSICKFY